MADPIAVHEAEEAADKPYDASDPTQIKAAKKRAGRQKTQRLQVIAAIMEQDFGRKWMYQLLERCHIYENPVVQGDPHLTYFKLGEANIGRLIMADVIAAAPDEYLKMCREAKEDK